MVLLCGKTFPRETKHTHLFSPERDPIIDQRKGTTEVESGETMIFLGLLTGVWMRGCLEEQERLKNNSYITKAHHSVGDSSQKLNLEPLHSLKPAQHTRQCLFPATRVV